MMHCLQDYKWVRAESATYMIRYKDNDTYRSAWRYSCVDGLIAGQIGIKIESVPVKTGLTIEQLNKYYFANPKVSKYVKTIYLPASGQSIEFAPNKISHYGVFGAYWSATETDRKSACYWYFNKTDLSSTSNGSKEFSYPVRPFRDKLR